MGERIAYWLVVLFFAIVIGVVFQQIMTSMTEQGIATGGPYDNAAAYPRAVAVIIGVLVVLQLLVSLWTRRRHSATHHESGDLTATSGLLKPVLLLVLFALYLAVLPKLGYHLATTPMLMAVMALCGVRKLGVLAAVALGIAFVLAFLFEFYLNIVLPGGVFALNIPW